jgi:alanyl-tRNA synthetase
MTRKLYFTTPAFTGMATLLEIGRDEERPYVILDATLFHPQGGGQKADRGTIGGVPVVHVAHAEQGIVKHYVASAEQLHVGDEVELQLDGHWRSQNSRLHSSGHLIAVVMEEIVPTLTGVAGHHWPGEARVDFEGAYRGELERLARNLGDAVAHAARADLPIISASESHAPRMVRIGSYPAQACGGTHVARLGEIHGIRIKSLKSKAEKLRVSYDVASLELPSTRIKREV